MYDLASVFQHVRQADAIQNGAHDRALLAQGQPPGHVDLQRLPIALELPLVQVPTGEAEADAFVRGQVARMLRCRPTPQ
jgi:hypothetical protein